MLKHPCMEKKARYRFVIDYFQKSRPVAETELDYRNPYQLLVAVILSAQCTDKRVNKVTPGFYARFPDAASLAEASHEEVLSLIKSISYPNNKATHLLGMAKQITEQYNGEVPDTLDQLLTLPGVGRKTANVMMAVAFHQPAMAVDTHVFRVSARLGLTEKAKTPYDTEIQLTQNFPRHLLGTAHHWLILHGRYICKARTPLCGECGLTSVCLYYQNQSKK